MGNPGLQTFNTMVTDAVFSPDGSRLAALGKQDDTWHIAVDGKVWKNKAEMAWKPVFSPDSTRVAARIEKQGKYTFVMNDRLWSRECDAAWDPVFSPDGEKILLRTIEDGKYYRRIVPVDEIVR